MRGGVFVCHASQDAGVAQRIVGALEAGGVPCWIAPRDIDPGENYATAILEGLAAAPAVVLVFSAATNRSPHVTRELETAVSSGTPIVPVRLEDVEPSATLRYFIGASHWLDTVGSATEIWEPPLVRAVRRTVDQNVSPAAPGPRSGLGPPGEQSSRADVEQPEEPTHEQVRAGRTKPRGRNVALIAAVGAGAAALTAVGYVIVTGQEDPSGSDGDPPASSNGGGLPSADETLPTGTVVWVDVSGGWRMRAALPDGRAVTILDGASSQENWPQVLPGGATVLYQRDADPTDGLDLSLHVAAADGTDEQAFLDGEQFCPHPARPAVSPGGLVAVTCLDALGNRLPGVVLLTETGELIDVVDADAKVGGVAWMPDGRHLVYWRETTATVNGEPGQQLYLIDVETSEITQLTKAPTRDGLPAVSPDGTVVAFTRTFDGRPDADLYLLPLTNVGDGYQPGSAFPHTASSPDVGDTDPAWATNESIIFCQDGALMRVDARPDATAEPALVELDEGDARHVTVVR